jgi:ABC-type branched-subunit amino acid transport system permease subunit
VIIFLSLHLLVRVSGQVSLATASFSAVGAAAFSHLVTGAHLPWALSLLGAGLVAVPIGALVAIPAIRLSGLYLAVATFGFAILLEQLFFSTGLMFGASGAINTPRPDFWVFGDDKGYYYVVLIVAVLMAGLAALVIRGRLGKLLRAMSDSPMALSTHGTSINISRVLIFCISAFMAGVAGALFGALIQSVNGSSFQFFKSLQYLAVLAISGAAVKYAPIPTALIAGASLAVIPAYINSDTFTDYLPVIFGVFAVLNALTTDRGGEHKAPPNVPSGPREGATRLERKRARGPADDRMVDARVS